MDCDKRAYADMRVARKVARELTAREQGRVNAYRCHRCRQPHVGHPPPMWAVEEMAREIRGLPPARDR